jgi:hypothetical protein
MDVVIRLGSMGLYDFGRRLRVLYGCGHKVGQYGVMPKA